MKPWLEKVAVEPGCSWSLLNRQLDDGIPFEWHHHPEFELTLTLNSRGHRLVGDHSGPYQDGDLVLVGPNLPHSWCSHSAVDGDRPHVALVAWFTEAWTETLVSGFPELAALGALFSEARAGVRFSAQTAGEVRPWFEALPEVGPPERLLLLLKVLQRLSQDRGRTQLCTPSGIEPGSAASDERMRRVLDHLHENFTAPLRVEDLAQIACVSPSTFHRLFRKHTRTTPVAYVTRLRIGRACSALSDSKLGIAAIAELAGFRNLANFNRQFRASKGVSPRAFRALYR